tara:strand:+ start:335 stop:907 length:573 start_codon:yes stop_codon:yes gene_type:complete
VFGVEHSRVRNLSRSGGRSIGEVLRGIDFRAIHSANSVLISGLEEVQLSKEFSSRKSIAQWFLLVARGILRLVTAVFENIRLIHSGEVGPSQDVKDDFWKTKLRIWILETFAKLHGIIIGVGSCEGMGAGSHLHKKAKADDQEVCWGPFLGPRFIRKHTFIESKIFTVEISILKKKRNPNKKGDLGRGRL